MNSTVTQSCSPIMPSNVSDRIEDCAKDYNVSLALWLYCNKTMYVRKSELYIIFSLNGYNYLGISEQYLGIPRATRRFIESMMGLRPKKEISG